MFQIKTTRHAKKRVRERFGGGKKGVDRIAARALKDGLKHWQISGGPLKAYLDSMVSQNPSATNLIIYCDKIWIFNCGILITCIKLKGDTRKIARKLLKRKK